MIKHTFRRVLAFTLAALMLMTCCVVGVGADSSDSSIKADTSVQSMKELLGALTYDQYLQEHKDVPRATTEVEVEDITDYIKEKADEDGNVLTDAEDLETVVRDGKEGLLTPANGTVSWKIDVPATGKYSIVMLVYPEAHKSTSIERIFRINGSIPFKEARYLTISKVWVNEYNTSLQDADRKFVTDIDNNEIRPTMIQKPEWRKYELHDANGFYTESFEFVFEAGENVISLEAVSEPLVIASIKLIPHESNISYAEYIAKYASAPVGTGFARFEAEYPTATSSQTIYPIEDRTDAMNSPSDTSKTLLNTLGGSKWQTAGQWVRYSFEVDATGLYQIVPRFKQHLLNGIFTSRTLRIRGGEFTDWTVPFTEANSLRFEYHRSNWQVSPLHFVDEQGNTHNIELYLEAGVEYEIEFEISLGDMGGLIRDIDTTLTNVNNAYLKIMKLTGSDPDPYRDYGFARIMPEVLRTLVDESINLYAYAAQLSEISGEKSSNIATLERIAWLLDRMGRDEEEIAKNLDQLKTYVGTLGTFLNTAKTQPLQLDYIIIQGAGNELPKARAGFFQALAHEFSSFIQSFFRKYDRMGAMDVNATSEDSVDVWLAYGRDQSQVIRNLINNDFTPNSNIPVNLKLVTGGTLLPSVLAGMGPDVYIGLDQTTVINYAIRNALMPLEGFDGFEETAAEFNEAAMMVLGIADATETYHTYGLPETQNFPMMFVRTDILADLGIDIPQTWDDLLAAVPVLQANNMEIGMPADVNIFLYQMGGELCADDGMRINLDSNIALDAFEMMCNMFTMYSFPYTYDFANRFRTGEMPIGIATYTATYNHLTIYATELKGLWQFVPLPGIMDENGNINNCSVSTTSAIVMLQGCDKPQEAWEFMEWHVGEKCQVEYSNEMVAILGPSAKHATANKTALESLPWTSDELDNLLLQFNNLASIPNYPGTYIIGRYTKFAFLSAYNDKESPSEQLTNYITTINKEITRKREEFGLETLEIGDTLAKKRVRMILEEVAKLNDAQKAELATLVDLIRNYNTDETMDVNAVLAAAEALASNEAYATIVKYAKVAANAHATYN